MQDKILELKVQIEGVKPPVYRTIQVPADFTFFQLHVAIQIAFEWGNTHLHIFDIDGEKIGIDDEEAFDPMLDETEIKLYEKIDSIKQKFYYTYDFGDNWEHSIIVMKILDKKVNTTYPRCVRGTRNSIPEDIGGIWGFMEFKEVINDKTHPMYEEMSQWYEWDGYDENDFDKKLLNQEYKEFDKICEYFDEI